MSTDLERLHKVATGKLSGRGCGKTVLLCHEIAGQLEIDPQDIIVTFSVLRYSEFFIHQLLAVLEEHDIRVHVKNQHTLHVLSTNTSISFVARDNPHHLRGLNAIVFREW